MMDHTPEPWYVFEADSRYPGIEGRGRKDTTIVVYGDVFELEGVRGSDHEHALANARRIVACVNACKGISTDRLEKMIPGTLANLLTLKGRK